MRAAPVHRAACCVLLTLLTSAGAVHAMEDPACGVSPIVTRSDALVYRLPHGFLRTGTDSVWSRRGPLRRDTDYALDRMRGELRLRVAPVEGETLFVRACWLLNAPPLSVQRQRYQPPAERADSVRDSTLTGLPPNLRPAVARDPYSVPSGTSLSVNGNKSIAVDFGSSQDAALRQSLDLAVSGVLAPGVTLTGVLSDRNTPLSAEGSTQELQALDRVLIELKAPQGSASLGDISLDFTQSEFGRLERRVQGARATANGAGFSGSAAIANAQGEYQRLQVFGSDGLQGPYQLTDPNGNSAISIVAGSEIVTLDGVRMVRGEAADYAIDYDRAQVTFSNRRPITSASRITAEYQFSLNRYRRNLLAADGGWQNPRARLFTRVLTENDDRGRPLDQTLSDDDRLVLAGAGDSASAALGPGVTPGVGDYDTVRVAGVVHFAFVGPDSGGFDVQFARVGTGAGDYADSIVIAGRPVFRYVGPGNGALRVGRRLPLPESHLLWTTSGGLTLGAFSLDAEAALSTLDRNVFSPVDDEDNLGGAGRARATLAGTLPTALGGVASLALDARRVGERFNPFTRLDAPFAQEDWGLPITTNIDRQERVQLEGSLRPRWGGTLRGLAGRLATPDGFESRRAALDWQRDGRLATRAAWQTASGRDPSKLYPDGGRDRVMGELRVRMPWLEPMLRYESDARSTPVDSGATGTRFREQVAELASGTRVPWRASAGVAHRRDALDDGTGYADASNTYTARAAVESPVDARLGVAMAVVRREVEPIGVGTRTRSDLASARVRGEQQPWGLTGNAQLEVTSEAQAQRVRTVVYVGPGQGAYDALGNFVGVGDYTVVTVLSPTLEPISRSATSARAGWQFGSSDALRGSRLEFTYETDARRRGSFQASDAAIPPGVVLGDTALARGSVLQRLEGEIAPGAAWSALRMRLERRVSAERSFINFAQTLDQRIATLRWRGRASALLSTEIEGRVKRDAATQSVSGGAQLGQTLREDGLNALLVWSSGSRWRAVAAGDASWVRPLGQTDATRTLRVGPDVGFAVGARGRAELSLRRAFISGPPAVSLLPTADPAGVPEIQANARVDYRVRDGVTFGVNLDSRRFAGRATRTVGRAELRAFF